MTAESSAGEPLDAPTNFWKFMQGLCRITTTVWFDFKAYGAENVPKTGGVLFVSNHQSYLDPVLIGAKLRRPMSYMAKSELFRNRFFGMLIRNLYAFPINQQGNATSAMKEAIRRLGEGRMLNIFPEGSRSPDGEMLPMESGAALVIRRAGVPVVPVAIDGSFEAWPRWKKIFRPHPVQLLYGEPLRLDGLDAKQITALIDRTLRELLIQLRQRRTGRWIKPTAPADWVAD